MASNDKHRFPYINMLHHPYISKCWCQLEIFDPPTKPENNPGIIQKYLDRLNETGQFEEPKQSDKDNLSKQAVKVKGKK